MIFRSLIYSFTYLLYGYVAWNSPGFDDEIFNIQLVEDLGINVIYYTIFHDAHPPLQYVFNYFLYEIFGDWRFVRLISAILVVTSIIYTKETLELKYNHLTASIAFILLISNPAILMWGTSIRWYSYFLPLLIFILVLPLKAKNSFYWIYFFLGLLILGNISYFAILIAPALFVLYWKKSEEIISRKINIILLYATIFFIFYSPNLYILFYFKLGFENQMFSLSRSLIGFYVSQFSNQGAFPISISGFLTSFGTFITIYSIISFKNIKEAFNEPYFISYIIISFLSLVFGLAGKFRTLVLLTPFQTLWISTSKNRDRKKLVFLIGISLISLGNILGLHNVISHKNTTKNNWNLPIKDTIKYLESERKECYENLIIFTYDPLLIWNLQQKDFLVAIPKVEKTKTYLIDNKYNCMFIIKTFQGSLNNNQYNALMNDLNYDQYSIFEKILLGYDKFYKYKKLLDKRINAYLIEIIKIKNPSNLKSLENWELNNNFTK